MFFSPTIKQTQRITMQAKTALIAFGPAAVFFAVTSIVNPSWLVKTSWLELGIVAAGFGIFAGVCAGMRGGKE